MPPEYSLGQTENLTARILEVVPLFEEDDEKPKYLPTHILNEVESLPLDKRREVITSLWAYGSINVYNHFFNKLRCPEAAIAHKR